jgi:hypothetical protein
MMDATDRSLRWHTTDFGNFVADAVRIAAGADIALINAGSFRIDGRLPPSITTRRLKDVFVYDHPDAIVMVDLTSREVERMCDHARTNGGHGRFLQVSGLENLNSKGSDTVTVALVRHMLIDGEDGYQRILAESRGVDPEDLIDALRSYPLPSGSIVGLIETGARKGVAYSDVRRLEALPSANPLELRAVDFIILVGQYCTACNHAGIKGRSECLELLETNLTSFKGRKLSPDLIEQRAKLQDFAVAVLLDRPEGSLFNELYEYLYHSPHSFRRNFPYQDFLSRAAYRVL